MTPGQASIPLGPAEMLLLIASTGLLSSFFLPTACMPTCTYQSRVQAHTRPHDPSLYAHQLVDISCLVPPSLNSLSQPSTDIHHHQSSRPVPPHVLATCLSLFTWRSSLGPLFSLPLRRRQTNYPFSKRVSHLETMTRYTPAPVSQHWDRWQQPHAGPDYAMMQVDSMVSYDPRPVPSTTTLQRPTMATQYAVATSYAESPVTPMASSPYGSQGHFSEYPPCTYQSPAVPSSSAFSQMPYRASHRPLAPPTPPLDEERGVRADAGRLNYNTGDTCQKSTRRSATVKPEVKEGSKDIKTIPKFVKLNGELQYESTRKFDLVLKLAEEKIAIKKEPQSGANTPESMGSPVAPPPEEEVCRPLILKHYVIC